jgi:hypothetical protein
MKPKRAAIAPLNPRNLAPTQTAMPTTFGPGMNWQRLKTSVNSSSSNQWFCSTAIRRAQTSPPPKLQSETLRNPMNNAASATCSADFRLSAIAGGSCMIIGNSTSESEKDFCELRGHNTALNRTGDNSRASRYQGSLV